MPVNGATCYPGSRGDLLEGRMRNPPITKNAQRRVEQRFACSGGFRFGASHHVELAVWGGGVNITSSSGPKIAEKRSLEPGLQTFKNVCNVGARTCQARRAPFGTRRF